MRNKAFSSISPSSVVWAAIPAVSAIAMVVLCALGLYSDDPANLGFFFVTAALTAVMSLFRDRVFPPGEASSARNLTLIGFAAILSCLALEIAWNDRYLLLPISLALLEILLVFSVMLAMHLFFQQRGAGPAIISALCLLFGIAQYFVMCFKNAAILPSDALAVGTAAAVAGGYRYEFGTQIVSAAAFTLLAVCLCAQIRPVPVAPGAERSRLLANLGGGAALIAVLALFVTMVSFTVFPIEIDYWWTLNKYREQGFLTSFIAYAQQLPIQKPTGYSVQKAEELQASYAKQWDNEATPERKGAQAQFETSHPAIVAVMNETFADLTLFGDLLADYEGPTFFKSVPEGTLSTGPLAVSVYGGGTCNTEFEFLTGNSLALTGGGKNPYSLYNLSGVESIPRLLKDQGYATVALHPNWPDNWYRKRIYPELGFDEFLSLADFDGAETYHDHVSDAATYKRVLELLRTKDEPLFVFDVTMQNHSGYDTGIIPEKDKLHFAPKGVSADIAFQTNEYLSCITEADRALKDFIAELRELKRPVMLVFFGDHQPFFTAQLDEVYDPEGTDIQHVVREYQTSYLVWANYNVSGADRPSKGDFTSPNYLGMRSLATIGAPLSEFQKSQLALSKKIPVFTLMCYLDNHGEWHQFGSDENAEDETLQELLTIGYYNFGSKV